MTITPKTSIPCELHVFSLFHPEQLMSHLSIDNYRSKIDNYGPNHPCIPFREETKVVAINPSRPENNTYLNGIYSMMHLLKQQMDNAPLNKLQKALILSAFPNSAKKVLSAFETPGAFLDWLKNKPEEVFNAMEMELLPMSDAVKQVRAAAYGMNSIEAKEYSVSGKIPKRFNAPIASAVAPDTRVPVMVSEISYVTSTRATT